jgi:hypothetical protein
MTTKLKSKTAQVVYASNGTKIKCAQGHCEHKTEVMGEDTHDEGLCWKITQEEFADKPTNAKYCPCTKQSNFIRTFARVGYIEREAHDIMIPQKCETCTEVSLFTKHQTRCLTCRTNAYNEPSVL